MNWEFLINETALARLVPDVYAQYRKPLLRALTLFVQGLPASRIKEILSVQAALPVSAPPIDRLVYLARSCPVLHKIGQTLARDPNLPLPARRGLQRLESFASHVLRETVKPLLDRELGPLERLGITLSADPVVEASVALVVPFLLAGPKSARRGVFKVLKPGIEERMEVELALLERVGGYLDKRCGELGIPSLNYRDCFEQVRQKLLNEVRLGIEQRNLVSAARFYQADPMVVIPGLFDFSTPRVTAMERISGRKVTETGQTLGKKEMARRVIDALISRPVFSWQSQALFHADPHAGNLFGLKGGGLAIIDWSLAGRLGEKERVSMMQIILGALGLSVETVLDALLGLATAPPAAPFALKAVVEKGLAQIRKGELPGFTWLKRLLDEAVQTAGLRVEAELMLFRRAIHIIEGVAADLEAQPTLIDRVFLSNFGFNFFAEWPLRFWMPPTSRAFLTRVSNGDLARLAMNLSRRASGLP
jgi:ubiquinone biosynthesis protein